MHESQGIKQTVKVRNVQLLRQALINGGLGFIESPQTNIRAGKCDEGDAFVGINLMRLTSGG